MEDELILSEQDRGRLDDIVSKMVANKESDANIQFVVNDFKQKYSVKKKRTFRIHQGGGRYGISYKGWFFGISRNSA